MAKSFYDGLDEKTFTQSEIRYIMSSPAVSGLGPVSKRILRQIVHVTQC